MADLTHRKRPAYQFYPGDEQRDTAVQSLSLAAFGLWRRMQNIMHDSEPYGHLTVAGYPIDVDDLARMVGESPSVVRRLVHELEAKKIFSRLDGGVIYSRRMVRDERVRNARAAGGILSQGHPDVPPRKDRAKGGGKASGKDTFALPIEGSPATASASARTTTTSASEAREKFSRVAGALDGSDEPELLKRFLAAVTGDELGFLGVCEKALGMGQPADLCLDGEQLAWVVAQYVSNLATGAERSVNRSRFEAYIARKIQLAKEPPRDPGAPARAAVATDIATRAFHAGREALRAREEARSR